jgi:hypothetical protein
MVYNTENFWVSWSLSIVRYRKKVENTTFRNWICFRPQVTGEALVMFGPVERANLGHWIIHVSITTAK